MYQRSPSCGKQGMIGIWYRRGKGKTRITIIQKNNKGNERTGREKKKGLTLEKLLKLQCRIGIESMNDSTYLLEVIFLFSFLEKRNMLGISIHSRSYTIVPITKISKSRYQILPLIEAFIYTPCDDLNIWELLMIPLKPLFVTNQVQEEDPVLFDTPLE